MRPGSSTQEVLERVQLLHLHEQSTNFSQAFAYDQYSMDMTIVVNVTNPSATPSNRIMKAHSFMLAQKSGYFHYLINQEEWLGSDKIIRVDLSKVSHGGRKRRKVYDHDIEKGSPSST